MAYPYSYSKSTCFYFIKNSLWPWGLKLSCCCQSLSHVQLFVISWTAACQIIFSFSISWNLLKLMSTESTMPSKHPIFCCPFSSFPQSFPASGGQSIGVSDSASVLPMNIQGWFPLGLTGLISLQSRGFLRVFSRTTVQKHQLFSAQASLWSESHNHPWLLEKT